MLVLCVLELSAFILKEKLHGDAAVRKLKWKHPPVPLADFSYSVQKEERLGQATRTLHVCGDPLVCFW